MFQLLLICNFFREKFYILSFSLSCFLQFMVRCFVSSDSFCVLRIRTFLFFFSNATMTHYTNNKCKYMYIRVSHARGAKFLFNYAAAKSKSLDLKEVWSSQMHFVSFLVYPAVNFSLEFFFRRLAINVTSLVSFPNF